MEMNSDAPSLTSQSGIAQPQAWKCPCCGREGEPVSVQVRQSDRTWADSTIKRCPNDECWHTFGGSLTDRIAHLNDVYGYKYFGDYELSPEQFDAVLDAIGMARQLPALLETLEFYANPEVYKPHPLGPAFDDRDLTFAARAAIAKVGGQQ